jgi:hypothetical protein
VAKTYADEKFFLNCSTNIDSGTTGIGSCEVHELSNTTYQPCYYDLIERKLEALYGLDPNMRPLDVKGQQWNLSERVISHKSLTRYI